MKMTTIYIIEEIGMKILLKFLLGGLFLMGLAPAAFCAERGTAQEAINMVKKAVVYLKKNGKEKTFAEINNPKGQFVDRDLYLAVGDLDGVTVAHGANPRLVGKNLIDYKDADEKYVFKEFINLAKTKGTGWVDYKFMDPINKSIQQKSSYIELVDGVYIACGIYK